MPTRPSFQAYPRPRSRLTVRQEEVHPMLPDPAGDQRGLTADLPGPRPLTGGAERLDHHIRIFPSRVES